MKLKKVRASVSANPIPSMLYTYSGLRQLRELAFGSTSMKLFATRSYEPQAHK